MTLGKSFNLFPQLQNGNDSLSAMTGMLAGVVERVGLLGADKSGFESQHCYLLTVRPWANYSTSRGQASKAGVPKPRAADQYWSMAC